MKFTGALLLAVVCFAAVASASSAPEPLTRRQLEFLFESWRIQYDVQFDSASEYIKRMDIFADNHWTITKHNAMNHSWTMAHNEFSHMTHDEFKSTMLGFGKVPVADYTKVNAHADATLEDQADSVDWTTKGAVTPVKNQGQCGSCWAFSTTGSLEGAYFLKNNKLTAFSEQELVDCDTVDQGCNGGLMDNAFGWIQKNGGLCQETGYAYTGSKGTCSKASCDQVALAPQHTDVAQTEAALAAAVAQQPVSIAIEADQSGFQFYSTGVFTGTCGTQLDHGVLVVGYGVYSDGNKYWKVKNSWGASWGSEGFILLQKGKSQSGGQCGILMSASYPTL